MTLSTSAVQLLYPCMIRTAFLLSLVVVIGAIREEERE